MPRFKRLEKITETLEATYPDAECELNFSSPLQLLVATILSAQSTDKRVNLVTPALFKKYRSARAFSRAEAGVLEELIHSTGFFRNKAKHIRAAAKIIDSKYGGRVPEKMDQLLELPGVARKTANVVLGVVFGKAEGVVVDTHVQRLSRRLGFSSQSRPEKIEQELMRVIRQEKWILFSHLLVHHGRRVCDAKKPDCANCSVEQLCESEDKRI